MAPCRVNQFFLHQVLKIHAGLSPPYMMEHFTPISDVHSYPTRFSTKAQCTDTIYLSSDSGTFANKTDVGGSFIKFPDLGCNFSKNQLVPLKLCNTLYIYITDLCLKFHSPIFYSFIFMQIIVNA